MTVTDEQKEELYRTYYKKVYGYLLSKLNHPQNAEDLAADVFVKIYSRLDSFDDSRASLSTWIYTITANTLTDYFRTRKVHDEIPETLDDGSDVEDAVCTAQMLEKLADALQTLEERERDILILRYYSGRTLRDIAAQMDLSYAYIKVLQNKALGKLKNFFA